MKALVTGVGGKMGHALVPALRAAGHETGGTEIDIGNLDALRQEFGGFRPDWVFHLAAFTLVDECEGRADQAYRANRDGARNVAQAALEVGAALLALSTDYVFSGDATRPYREQDPPGPLSVYGTSKLAGERLVREVHPRHIIVRTAWLFGRGGRADFMDKVLGQAERGQPLRVVDDQRGSPTWTGDLARALVKLAEAGQYGTYHCTNAGECTWYDLAVYLLARTGFSVPIARIDSATLGSPAKRPAYSVMSNAKFEQVTGHRMPPWQDAVDRYLSAGAPASRGAEERR